ncbi:hypothetical protein NOU13_28120 [Rhodococcus erythropolis]|uniref:hypothetical protein n=1 Tax=Rhodococcus erythropolis TaxID=1833 RepID=UPI002108A88E|nr:hypothetical protein [Rhodococcus erythropolis]MCQ4128370.1 hypothetical protein [Rhodococcus erythropolis]
MRRGEPLSVDLLTAKAAKEATEKAISAARTTCTDANSQRRAEVEHCIAESGTGGIAQNDLTGLV